MRSRGHDPDKPGVKFPAVGGPDPYGVTVERTRDGTTLMVDYHGLDAVDFARRLKLNHENGWAPLALGRLDPRKPHEPPHKRPWHTGLTGWDGIDATPAQAETWAENIVTRIVRGERGILNLGARMQAGAIGLDVDAYDGKRGLVTLAEYENRCGTLPPTYRITARPYESGSGIRLFRVPLDWIGVGVLKAYDGSPGHVDVIQRHHRFMVAPGGLHHSEARYRLYGPNGHEITGGVLPPLDAIPWLPGVRTAVRTETETWLTALAADDAASRRLRAGRNGTLTQEERERFADQFNSSHGHDGSEIDPDPLDEIVTRVAAATQPGQTNPAYHKALWKAAHRARAKCCPWSEAKGRIKTTALKAYAQRHDGAELDEVEFERSADHAIVEALACSDDEIEGFWNCGERTALHQFKDFDFKGLFSRLRTENGAISKPAYRRAYQPAYRRVRH